MEWTDFVDSVCNELIRGNLFSDFRHHFEDEQALTRRIAVGLRTLFASSFNLPIDSDDLYGQGVRSWMLTFLKNDAINKKVSLP